MRGRLLAITVSGLLAVSLAGCGTARTGEQTATPLTPATDVCRDVVDCKVVSDADVDGDGVRDQVGFVSTSERRVSVHVATAAGDRLQRDLDIMWFPRGEFYGTAPVDGRPGEELVVGTAMGAHTLWFTTLSVRSGRLEVLEAPGDEEEWVVDGAYSFHAGVERRTEDGQVLVTLREAAREDDGTGFVGRDRTYVWAGDGWQHRSTRRTAYDGDAAAAEVGGWHVDGLPRFPDF